MKKEHKVQQKTLKNKNLILISAVVLVIIAAAIIFGSMPMAQQPIVQANSQDSNPASTFTTTGAELLIKETTQSLPYFESVTLEPGRYNVQVVSSAPVWVRVYDQIHFDDWQSSGEHGSARTGTNMAVTDKVTDFNRNFDVGTGEEGRYYLVIAGDGSPSLQLKITQILKF